MKRAKRIRVKGVFKSNDWEILSVIDEDKKYRIEAKRVFPIKDEINHFIGYGGREYVQNLARDYNYKID